MRAKEGKFENGLAQERAVRQRYTEKVKSKISKLWRYFKSQQARSLTVPSYTTLSEDDDQDELDTTDLGDSSRD